MGVPSWGRHSGHFSGERTTAAPLLCGGASPVVRRKAAVRDAVVRPPTLSHLTSAFPDRSLTYRRHFPIALSLNVGFS